MHEREKLTMSKPRHKRYTGQKPGPHGSHDKATLSHEKRLQQMMKKPVEMSLLSGHTLEGILVGYDAFTLTVEVQGVERTYFKHSLESFAPAADLH